MYSATYALGQWEVVIMHLDFDPRKQMTKWQTNSPLLTLQFTNQIYTLWKNAQQFQFTNNCGTNLATVTSIDKCTEEYRTNFYKGSKGYTMETVASTVSAPRKNIEPTFTREARDIHNGYCNLYC